jgi:hypothetical protein
VRSGVLGAALACLAPSGACVGGAVLGALARRREAVAAAERRVLRSLMADGCCNPPDGCSAVGGGAARVLREYYPRRGSIHRPSGPHGGRRAAQSLARACARGATAPLIRTARRAPSRPITRRSPSHRRPMVRWRGTRSAIARGGSCAAGGARASMRSESAVAGMSLQMTWAGRSRRSSAG